jgi:site-specific DNA-methyltransferase (adenine-specific)
MFTLHNGDCLQILPSIPSGSIDAIITDLPYGTTACKWDTVIEFAPMWEQVKRVLKPKGAFITTASQPFTSALIMSNPSMFKYAWVWEKVTGSGLLAKYRPVINHEDIPVFSNGSHNYYPILTKRERPITQKMRKKSEAYKYQNYGDERVYTHVNPKSIITFQNRNGGGKIHPTQKPVALYEYLIKTYTNEGETVLDIAMGSGTTIEAAERTGRNSIGIEKDEVIFQSAVLRLKSFTPSNKACSGQEPLAERLAGFE